MNVAVPTFRVHSTIDSKTRRSLLEIIYHSNSYAFTRLQTTRNGTKFARCIALHESNDTTDARNPQVEEMQLFLVRRTLCDSTIIVNR